MSYMMKTFPSQDTFFRAVMCGLYRYLMLAGDVRSGKSIIQLMILVILCKIFSGSRWVVIRKDFPTLKRTSIATFFKWCCPSSFFEDENKSLGEVLFRNGSKILFMAESIRGDYDLNRFKGLEVNGALLEQAEELNINTYYKISERVGQWKLSIMPPRIVMLNCNPNNDWPSEVFYRPWKEGTLKPPYYFQEASILDNPHHDIQYIEDQRLLLPIEVFNRFFNRDWENIDSDYRLIDFDTIGISKAVKKNEDNTKYLGCDVGRQGNDSTVLVFMEGYNIVKKIMVPKTRTTEVRDLIITKGIEEEKILPENICIDCTGIGGGVYDELLEKGYRCIEFIGGSTIENTLGILKFLNLRAFSHWYAKEEMKNGRVGGFTDSNLIAEAKVIKYKIVNDKCIQIIDKDKIKASLGRSPDTWDGFTYAVWARLSKTLYAPGIACT